MNGMMKICLMTAPVLALVIYLSFFKVQEHTVRMEKDSASFDRDWNEGMDKFAKTKGDKAKFKKRSVAAQKELDGLDADLKEAKAKTGSIGKDLDKAMSDAEAEKFEKKLEAGAHKKAGGE